MKVPSMVNSKYWQQYNMELSHSPISRLSLTFVIIGVMLQLGCSNDQEEHIDELAAKILVQQTQIQNLRANVESLMNQIKQTESGIVAHKGSTEQLRTRITILEKENVPALIEIIKDQDLVINNLENQIDLLGNQLPAEVSINAPENMQYIPAGEYSIGDPFKEGDKDEQPVKGVFIDAFYMDTHEVTVGQYKNFLSETNYTKPNWAKIRQYSPTDQHPILYITWHDAMAYAKWEEKRLPTEAEWEYAARGGITNRRYPWGNDINTKYVNYKRQIGKTVKVGSYPPNSYGLHDISGNVAEWCLDGYDQNFYIRLPRKNPFADGNIQNVIQRMDNIRTFRIIRGGSWHGDENDLRVANRNYRAPSDANRYFGFRCVKSLKSIENIRWNQN